MDSNRTMIDFMEGNVMDLHGDGWKVLAGSCLDRLPELADESVDAVVCDPPYELGFMGKSWDSSGIAYDVNVWKECLRVLKPGGHVLAFGGSRTWHRLAVAVEDAGFELRDSIAWLYGSGFPKSLDVSKAIDKQRDDVADIIQVTTWLRASCEDLGWNRRKLCEAWGVKNEPIQQWTDANPKRATVPTWENWQKLKKLVGFSDDMDSEVWRLNERKGQLGEAWSERVVTGEHKQSAPHQIWEQNYTDHVALPPKIKKDKPATVEAQKWSGWGTALKPAFEPVVVGRKPLKGTVAANVLAYGVGGLNIDATRIGTTVETWPATRNYSAKEMSRPGSTQSSDAETQSTGPAPAGRWPSNVILDEYTAELVDQQSGVLKSGSSVKRVNPGGLFGLGGDGGQNLTYGDSGGASRFFYIAKANKRDRNEGLNHLEEVKAASMKRNLVDGQRTAGDGVTPISTPVRQNFHPTVKPTDLMRQLIRLVTPLGGVVLDPFTGSGSTGKAAILEGMQFIGCELTEDYLPIIEGRINWAVEQVKQDKLKAEQESAEVLF